MNRSALSHVLFILIAACTAVGWPCAAHAQNEDSSNAATWYRRAYARLDTITPEQWDLISEYKRAGGTPSPEVRAILQRAQPAIADLQRATGQSYNDFGLDYSKGVYMEMPQLQGLRNLARIAAADATMRIADGDGAGAAGEIESLYRMVNNVSGDHVMISSLVSTAVFALTDPLIDTGYDAGVFSDGESAMLLQTMQSFDQLDPFGSVDAMVGEQFMAMQTMRNAIDSGDPIALSDLDTIIGTSGGGPGELANMDAQAIRTEMDSYSKVMDQYVAAFAMDDPEAAKAEIARLDAACANGDFGVLASILAPAFGNCYSGLDRGRQMLHDRTAALEKIVGGEVAAGDLANAAVWYRRGIEKLDALDDAWKQAMAQIDPMQPLSSDAIKALDDGKETAAAAIQQFVDGSKIRHCDFSKKRDEEGRESFVPLYASGMRDAFRLLALESLRCEAAGDHAEATRLLATAFRMDAHMAGDRLLVSSLVAREGFLLTAQVGQAMDARQSLDDATQPELSAAIRRCGTGDPFGFIAAMTASRTTLRDLLLHYAPKEKRQVHQPELETWLRDIDADGLVYLMAIKDAMGLNADNRGPFNPTGARSLGEFLLPETMELAQIDMQPFIELVDQQQEPAFEIPETSHIVGVTSLMATARQDLWNALAWERAREAALREKEQPQP